MMSPRRILILNERDPAHPRAGGAEIHVREIFSRLAARGDHVVQYSTGFSGGANKSLDAGIEVERCGPLPRYYANLPGRLRQANRGSPFSVIVECLNKIPYYTPLLSKIPTLALCHHLFGEVAFSQVSWPIAAGVWFAERGIPFAYRKNHFLAISESTRDDLIARGISPDRIHLSHPGIDPPSFEIDRTSSRPRRICYVGRLEPYKKVDVMLRAAAKLTDRFPDLEISIIGRGPDRPRLEALARQLEIDARIEWAGFVDDAERDRLLASARVCAFPSEKEGWGLTVIEANAVGTPVVASDAPGLRDSIRDAETGLLASPGDIDAFAAALARLLDDGPFADEMRAACFEWSQRFRWDRAADDMSRAIDQVISESRGVHD